MRPARCSRTVFRFVYVGVFFLADTCVCGCGDFSIVEFRYRLVFLSFDDGVVFFFFISKFAKFCLAVDLFVWL